MFLKSYVLPLRVGTAPYLWHNVFALNWTKLVMQADKKLLFPTRFA